MLTAPGAAEDSETPVAAGRVFTRALLGSSAVCTLVFGVVTSKVAAVLIGPAGLGYLAIVQGLGNFVAMLVGLELGSALIRTVPASLAAGPVDGVQGRLGAAFRLMALASVAVLVMGILTRDVLGPILFDRVDAAVAFVLVLGAGILYSWAMLLVAILAAHQATTAVAIAMILSPASTPIVTALGYGLAGEPATPVIALVSSVLSLVTTVMVVRAVLGLGIFRCAFARGATGPIRELLSFGIPKLAGTVVSGATLLAVPLVIRRELGYEPAGEFRAAQLIAMAFSTVVIVALSYDFFARVSEVRSSPRRFCKLITDELILMSLLANAFAVVAICLAPVLVRVLYSASFDPVVGLLRILLVAQSIQVGVSVLFLALNASVSGRLVGVATFVGPLLMVLSLPLVIDQVGLLGAGAAAIGGYVVSAVTCYSLLRSKTSFRLSAKVLAVLLTTSVVPLGVAMVASMLGPLRLAMVAAVSLGILAAAGIALAPQAGPRPWDRVAIALRRRRSPT